MERIRVRGGLSELPVVAVTLLAAIALTFGMLILAAPQRADATPMGSGPEVTSITVDADSVTMDGTLEVTVKIKAGKAVESGVIYFKRGQDALFASVSSRDSTTLTGNINIWGNSVPGIYSLGWYTLYAVDGTQTTDFDAGGSFPGISFTLIGNTAAAGSVANSLVQALYENESPTQSDIDTVKEVYSALSDEVKALVIGYDEAVTSAQAKVDQAAASTVQAKVDALVASASPTQADIDAVKTVYGILTANQQALVTGYDAAITAVQAKVDATAETAIDDSSQASLSESGQSASNDMTVGTTSSASETSANSTTAVVTAVTMNGKKATVSAIAKAVAKSGGSTATVKTVTLGMKVKSISKGAFKKLKKCKTLVIKTKKLTKKSVKGALKGSKVKVIKVGLGSKKLNKKYVKKYKKVFAKANSGKKVTVK